MTAAAIAVIGGAGPFGRDHRRAQRTFRRAADAEGRALVRLLVALQTPSPAMHSAGSSAVMRLDAEAALGVELGDRPRGAPGRWRESRRSRATSAARPRRPRATSASAARLPSGRTAAGVLVLDLGPARFELLDAHQHALQDVQRLEAGDHDRHVVLLRRSADIRPCP